MSKKVAIICNYKLLPERVGGMDYFFWAFQNACSVQNIEVDWFFPNSGTHGKYYRFNILSPEDSVLETHFINHIRKHQVSYSHIITHFVELCTSFYADIKKYQSAKIIAVDHNPRPLGGYPLKKQIKKRIKGLLYSKYIDLFIGVSKYTSKAILYDFGRFLKIKTQTIYNGVLIDDIIAKTTERARINPKFLVVSHLRASKGIQDLIKAVSLLSQEQKKQLTIDVYGDGPYNETLTSLVCKYNLQAVFKFKGSHSSIKSQYQFYDYLIQPTHMECFSLSILESLAANVPVITTPVGGNTEVVFNHRNGFIFETKNIKALFKLISEIIQGETYITENTRPQIKNDFSMDLMVAKHLKLLQI